MLKVPSDAEVTGVVSRLAPGEPYPVDPATNSPSVDPLTGNWPPCTLPLIAAPVIGVLSPLVKFMLAQPEANTTVAVIATAKAMRRRAFEARWGVRMTFAASADIRG